MFTSLALLILTPIQWGPAGCGPVGPPHFSSAPAYEWHTPAHSPQWRYLFCNGVHVGGLDTRDGVYLPFDGTRWGKPATPPVPPPSVALNPALQGGIPNYGVDYAKINPGEHYRVNGRPVSGPAAAFAGADPKLPCDADKLRLTAIGTEQDCKAVKDDYEKHPALAQARQTTLLQCYRPDARMIAGLGFVTTGRPTIYLQKPDGTVLHRQDDYVGGADKLAEAIRKADANYDARRDPNLTRPFSPAAYPEWIWYAAIAVIAFAFIRRGNPPQRTNT